MNGNRHRMMSVLVMTLAAAVLSLGCHPNKKTIEWTEEVPLSDGKVAEVHQTRVSTLEGEIANPGWETRQVTLEIQQTSGGKVIWTGETQIPLLLDKDPRSGDLVLISRPLSESTWQALGSPRPPYAFFRFKGGTWTQERVNDFVWGRKANLLIDEPEKSLSKVIGAEERNALNDKARATRGYKSIIRDAQLIED